MVAMFSLFCGATTDSPTIFSSCLPPHNGGYDYLLFSSAPTGPKESSDKNDTSMCQQQKTKKHRYRHSVVLVPSVVMPKASKLYRRTSTDPDEKLSEVSVCRRLRHRCWSLSHSNKAASEPPPECLTVASRKVLRKYSSFREPNSTKSATEQNISFVYNEKGRKVLARKWTATSITEQNDPKIVNGRFSRFMHFLESLNPLNGFKDKDNLETYLYNQSQKIEPKNGEILNPKPKHPPEALKSPGVKQQKTPVSGGIPRFPTTKSSGKSSASSPHSPGHALGGGALLSPSHINVPTRSPVSIGSASGSSASMALTDDPNFAIVDISPGHFPRWLGDTCGRINPAFISEYASASSSAYHHQIPPGGSPTSPGGVALHHQLQQQQRKRPPAPLSAGESHFTFPPQHHSAASSSMMFRKPPAPFPPLQTHSEEQQQQQTRQMPMGAPQPPPLSFLPAFPLAKPPPARKKLPAADPPTSLPVEEQERINDSTVASSSSSTTDLTLQPPQLPPRLLLPSGRQHPPYQQSPLANFMMGVVTGGSGSAGSPEASAPPRPPKKGICKSPTADQPQQQSPSPVAETAEAVAPPLPPKPATAKPKTAETES